jgi:hypothetical protein
MVCNCLPAVLSADTAAVRFRFPLHKGNNIAANSYPEMTSKEQKFCRLHLK